MFELIYSLYTSINSNTFLTYLGAAIIIVACFAVIRYIINLLGDARSYLMEKTYHVALTNKEKEAKDEILLTMPERIELTDSVLDLVSYMINSEIISYLKSYISLNNLYPIQRLDDDIAAINTAIFNGINKDLFTNPNLIFTQEYLLSFITKKITMNMIDVVQNHNDNIRASNNTEV